MRARVAVLVVLSLLGGCRLYLWAGDPRSPHELSVPPEEGPIPVETPPR